MSELLTAPLGAETSTFYDDWDLNIIIEDAIESSLERRKDFAKQYESTQFIKWVQEFGAVRIYLGRQAGHSTCGLHAICKYFSNPLILTTNSVMADLLFVKARAYGILPKEQRYRIQPIHQFIHLEKYVSKLDAPADSIMIDPASDSRLIAAAFARLNRGDGLFNRSPNFTILMVGG